MGADSGRVYCCRPSLCYIQLAQWPAAAASVLHGERSVARLVEFLPARFFPSGCTSSRNRLESQPLQS